MDPTTSITSNNTKELDDHLLNKHQQLKYNDWSIGICANAELDEHPALNSSNQQLQGKTYSTVSQIQTEVNNQNIGQNKRALQKSSNQADKISKAELIDEIDKNW